MPSGNADGAAVDSEVYHLLDPPSSERPEAEVVAAQAARCLLVRLLVGESVLDDVEVVDALVGLALAHLAARARDLALELDGRKLDVQLDRVVEAKVVVDVASGHLARVDGADDGGGPALAVAAGRRRPSWPGTAPSESVTMRPRLQGTPCSSKVAESMSWPMATITRSHGMTTSPPSAGRGAGRPRLRPPMICGLPP